MINLWKCIKYPTKSKLVKIAMENWKVEQASGEKTFAQVKIQRGIFQRDSLLPPLFVIAMMQLNYVFRKCTERFKF